ncbi:CoA pyrophosphatase [Arthrobacter sp. H5]|uniref:NUDIX hydrolase n=1 Tax=Arthrobacter sp. H5 TaxID=1267973 RepID=UPI0009DF41C2|nr:CoA pyrophosphatase [Arthrobacter sp. H5]
MSAYGQLRAYADRAARTRTPRQSRESWQLWDLDPAAARPAAVLVLFGTLDDRPSEFHSDAVPDDLDVLLVVRSINLAKHPGQVAFPGGGIDNDDDGPVAAALREAREETGLDPGGVEVLGTLPEVGLPVSNYMVTPVLAWWTAPTPVDVVDRSESSHVFRAPVADLLSPDSRCTVIMRRRGLSRRSPAFQIQGVTVWGFTGILLAGLFDGLGWEQPWDEAREIEAPR